MTKGRLHELDSVRGLAALTVAASHILLHFQGAYGFSKAPAWLQNIDPAVIHFSGLLPVCLFFMVSGFVIYMTLHRCETWLDFAASRITRLYPAYWIALGLVICIRAFDPASMGVLEPSLSQSLVNITMFQEFFRVPHLDPIYWTLTYELRFYIFIALIFFTPLKKYFDHILIGWLTMSIAVTLLGGKPGAASVPDYFNLQYAHFFVAGIAFYKYAAGERSTTLSCLIAASALAVFLQWSFWPAIIGVSFWLLFWGVATGSVGFLNNKVLIWLGTISYALYLVHLPLGHSIAFAMNAFALPAPLIAMLALATTLAVATAITYLVEKPAIKWQRGVYRQWREDQDPVLTPAAQK